MAAVSSDAQSRQLVPRYFVSYRSRGCRKQAAASRISADPFVFV